MLLDLGAEHNVEEKGENEAVSENLNDVVVELEDKIDKEKVMKVFVIKSEPKAELEADLDSQEGTPLCSLETNVFWDSMILYIRMIFAITRKLIETRLLLLAVMNIHPVSYWLNTFISAIVFLTSPAGRIFCTRIVNWTILRPPAPL